MGPILVAIPFVLGSEIQSEMMGNSITETATIAVNQIILSGNAFGPPRPTNKEYQRHCLTVNRIKDTIIMKNV